MQSALNEQQEQYEHEVGKLVNVINSYGADAEKLRKRAEKCDLLEQQLQDRHNI
jgi:Spy/CpxP family protein refolding chaperone